LAGEHAAEDLRAASAWEEPQGDLRQREHCVGARDYQIAVECKLASAAQRPAANRRNQRHGDPVDSRPRTAGVRNHALVCLFGHPTQIGAGSEGPVRSCQDYTSDVLIGFEALESLGYRTQHRRPQSIPGRLIVDAQEDDPSAVRFLYEHLIKYIASYYGECAGGQGRAA
jgi:hypothetical protein